jgi:signal transduction histidine kinase
VRGKFVSVVVLTTILTLLVAAVKLLAPLEQQLRTAEQTTLLGYMLDAKGAFTRLTDAELLWNPALPAADNATAPRSLVSQLARRTGAQIELLGYPNVVIATSDLDGTAGERFDDVLTAFNEPARRPQPVETFGHLAGTEVAQEAMPLTIAGTRYVLAARRPIDEIPRAVKLVTRAFVIAALAGIALALLLGIPLTGRLVRRLRRLHHAAYRLGEGGPVVELPGNAGRDEVGDLTRTFLRMQERLQQQEDGRRAFLATASHELRTPLASLRGMLEMLEEDLAEEPIDLEDARRQVHRAGIQSQRLGRLASDLLDLTRLDAQLETPSEPVELAELTRAVLAEFELDAAARNIKLRVRDPAEPRWALANPGSVARILRILLDNAMRVSATDREIRIRIDRTDHDLRLDVSDDGPGVRVDERERIFERFQRGSATGSEPGFGLGLAIGRQLAERMGGKLTVAESPADAGATFELHLAAAFMPDHAAVARPA